MRPEPSSTTAVRRRDPRSAVTICLVPEARGGPFVLWEGIEQGCQTAAKLGFDGVELFVPSADAVDSRLLQTLLADHGLALAAVGTGAGWLLHRLSLSAAEDNQRQKAVDFVRSIVDFAGEFSAPAIIGSMQGRSSADLPPSVARGHLRDAMQVLAERAAQYDAPLLLEPLNRYESDVVNTLSNGRQLLEGISNVRLLADLFHMNIEEADMAAALRDVGPVLGHVHFVDSNRQAVGHGHLDPRPIASALQHIGFGGFVSAEALPLPNPLAAAEATINSFRDLFK